MGTRNGNKDVQATVIRQMGSAHKWRIYEGWVYAMAPGAIRSEVYASSDATGKGSNGDGGGGVVRGSPVRVP